MTDQDVLERDAQPSKKMIQALSNVFFPALDSQLRAGRHIGQDDFEAYSYLMTYQSELASFYERYHVELIRAPEAFFYLRPRASTLIARSVLSQLEMLVGKVLCSLYLSPERLAQEGIFTLSDLYEELLTLTEPNQLLKALNQRSNGSDLDKQKLFEKVRTALNRLKKMGMITFLQHKEDHFRIHEAVFRFAADVRQEDQQMALRQLIQNGEAILSSSIEKQDERNQNKEQEQEQEQETKAPQIEIEIQNSDLDLDDDLTPNEEL